MEGGGRVEPQAQPLLPVALAVDDEVGLEGHGPAGLVAQELEVDFVVATILWLRNKLLGMNVHKIKRMKRISDNVLINRL